jgi:putative holliday junction resolvase
VGGQRIGLATANSVARIASPFQTIANNDDTMEVLHQIIEKERVAVLVVGLPRGLSGQETAQTRVVEEFAEMLSSQTGMKVYMQDEAVTSKKAEAELQARGKPYEKGDIDALAATYILEDFLVDHPEIKA